jgi:hypothetical protein
MKFGCSIKFNYFYVKFSSYNVNRNETLRDRSCILNKMINFKEYLSLLHLNELQAFEIMKHIHTLIISFYKMNFCSWYYDKRKHVIWLHDKEFSYY